MTATRRSKLSVREAAARTGRNPETIRRWIRTRRLPASKTGNVFYIEATDLDVVATAEPVQRLDTLRDSWQEWLAERDQQQTVTAIVDQGSAADLVLADRDARASR